MEFHFNSITYPSASCSWTSVLSVQPGTLPMWVAPDSCPRFYYIWWHKKRSAGQREAKEAPLSSSSSSSTVIYIVRNFAKRWPISTTLPAADLAAT